MQDIFLWYELSGGMIIANKDHYLALDCVLIEKEFNLLNLS